ncbi:MAG: response regulator [Myxococcaceae bacterium]
MSPLPASRVVVAEDHPVMRALISSTLRKAGFEVDEFADGQMLWHQLDPLGAQDNRLKPDLIVTDVRMPRCSGLELLERLRHSDWVQLPVIVMTAFGDHELHSEARRLGAASVFNKPFDVRALVREVQRLVPH